MNCFLLCDDDCSKTGSNKVSSQIKLVILTFYFIAVAFPRAIEMVEPIDAQFATLFRLLELPVCRETAIANSHGKFSR